MSILVPLPQVEQANLERGRRPPAYARAGEWGDKVQKAIKTLEESGKPVTQESISHEVGLSVAALLRYPQIRDIFSQFTKKSPGRVRRFQRREDELLDKVQTALKNLEALGRPISKTAIGKTVGMNTVALEHYPRVKALMEQAVVEYTQKHQDQLVEKILKAVEQLRSLNKRISPQAVGDLIGLSSSTLRCHRGLLAIMKQAEKERRCDAARLRQVENQLREERLVDEVQKAIQHLEALGEPVFRKAVSKMVGVSVDVLVQYPRVKALLKQIVAKRWRGCKT